MSVYSAKVDLSKYLKLLEKGDEVVISNHGRPVGKLVPFTSPGIKLGLLEGKGFPELEPEDFYHPESDDRDGELY